MYICVCGPQKAHTCVCMCPFMGRRKLMYMSSRRLTHTQEGVCGPQEAYVCVYVCVYVHEPTYGPQKSYIYVYEPIYGPNMHIRMYVHKAPM